ncbi:GntR family transcriptional regulator [Lacicoccus qingdaonensis]|uniref:Transcriptional regulator, GntR family n=1 Tax=Lacicoccus qingdaonensis TaxID=576118 RepID=A0A1G9BLZ4_9BACL|nr:GntR family transcriptional regulator [Salinicoccus qingdaonensis]SDK40496.1 transcriptional regulator, GntR family [Salinicoccus qingdaonensis]
MNGKLNEKKPIFEQIKDWISDQIIDETLVDDDKIPSTNEIVEFFKVNHLTVAKGVNQLVDQGVIYKKRGVGMFVAEDARNTLLKERKHQFKDEYVKPMIEEMSKLGLTEKDLNQLIEIVKEDDHGKRRI